MLAEDGPAIALLIIVIASLFLSARDGRGDYNLSYSAWLETGSQWGYSDHGEVGARERGYALNGGIAGEAGDGKRSLGSWRRQDKAAGRVPFRSVSTPRAGKQLRGAPALPHGCTTARTLGGSLGAFIRVGHSARRGTLS